MLWYEPINMTPPEARWIFELRSICLELRADCSADGQTVTVRAETTMLRLTDFHAHLLVNVGLSTPQGTRWVGFLTVARTELPEFLRNTLPLSKPDQSRLAKDDA
jgi:hypothetical protein